MKYLIDPNLSSLIQHALNVKPNNVTSVYFQYSPLIGYCDHSGWKFTKLGKYAYKNLPKSIRYVGNNKFVMCCYGFYDLWESVGTTEFLKICGVLYE